VDPKYLSVNNVLFHPLNGKITESIFDELLQSLTKGGMAVPYAVYLHPEPNDDTNCAYIYVAKYELNIIEEKMRDYNLQQKMVKESTRFIMELEKIQKKK
jgi:hypothetical protein